MESEKMENYSDQKSDSDCLSELKEGCDVEIEYLDTPIKSENDKKEYRVVRLRNGLTALLISDFQSTKSKDINNNNVEEKMAACGLCVNVGSFSDPPEIQGLAHYIEHVISVNSESEYEKFVKEKGGLLHADTGYERTMYLFQIHPDYLLPAVKRFAQLFIIPVFDKSAALRERESVDNEFFMDLSSDNERLKKFFRIIPSNDHPASKFSCGNLITLRDNVEEDKLYEDLHAFRKRHYSAHRMKLVIQATLSLDVLEACVRDCFSDVPANYLPPIDFARFSGVEMFDATKFQTIYKVKAIRDTSEMELKWIMPPSRHLYRYKPLNYIKQIINREGKGSLSHCLRNKKLCSRVTTSIDQCSIYSVLKLNLILLNEGSTRTKEILDIVFSYLTMLRRHGLQKEFFEDLQCIAKTKFRFSEEMNAAANVQSLCHDMHLYCPADYINGADLYSEYNPNCIQSFLDCLTPKNCFVVLLDKSFNEDEFNEIEPYYRIKYMKTSIPNGWIRDWENIEPLAEFSLPEPNPFIATKFELIRIPDFTPNYPVRIERDDKLEIWFKQDAKFRIPNTCVYLHLITADLVRSPSSYVMLRLFQILMYEIILEKLYNAKQAGLACNILANHNGVLVNVNGYSEKVPTFLKFVVKYINKFSKLVTEDIFNLVKAELLKYYSSVLYDPGILACEITSSILESDFWLSTEKHAVLKDVKYEQFVEFAELLTDKVFIRCLVQGNVTRNEAVKMIRESIEPLKCGSLRANRRTNVYNCLLPLNQKCCRVKNLNSKDANSVVMNYYQTDVKFSKMSLPIFKEFLEMILHEALFNQLRIKEQLGYYVSCSAEPGGFSITIYSPAHKFTTKYVDERIENFMKYFIDSLKQMTEDNFNAKKEYFNKLKKCSIIRLQDEVDRNWFAVNTLIFDEREEQILAFNSMKIEEFQQWITDHFIGGKNFRKLSVQVIGNVKSVNISNTKGIEQPKIQLVTYNHCSLTFLTDSDSQTSNDYYITDLNVYKVN